MPNKFLYLPFISLRVKILILMLIFRKVIFASALFWATTGVAQGQPTKQAPTSTPPQTTIAPNAKMANQEDAMVAKGNVGYFLSGSKESLVALKQKMVMRISNLAADNDDLKMRNERMKTENDKLKLQSQKLIQETELIRKQNQQLLANSEQMALFDKLLVEQNQKLIDLNEKKMMQHMASMTTRVFSVLRLSVHHTVRVLIGP